MEGDQFTIADIAVGAFARRWLGFTGINKPAFPHVERWYKDIASRASFAKQLAMPMS